MWETGARGAGGSLLAEGSPPGAVGQLQSPGHRRPEEGQSPRGLTEGLLHVCRGARVWLGAHVSAR